MRSASKLERIAETGPNTWAPKIGNDARIGEAEERLGHARCEQDRHRSQPPGKTRHGEGKKMLEGVGQPFEDDANSAHGVDHIPGPARLPFSPKHSDFLNLRGSIPCSIQPTLPGMIGVGESVEGGNA